MEKKNVMELLPIGSIVLLKGAEKRMMIFGICQTDSNSKKEYDYLGVMYPEGNIGDDVKFLFNHSDIERVEFMGYHDDERAEFLGRLQQFFDQRKKG